jgi:hypothetical protein
MGASDTDKLQRLDERVTVFLGDMQVLHWYLVNLRLYQNCLSQRPLM